MEEQSNKRKKMDDNSAEATSDHAAIDGKLKEPSAIREENVFENFKFVKVLKADSSRKIAFIHGALEKGNSKSDAVAILEQSAFDLNRLEELFAAKAPGTLQFNNDLYHSYRIFLEREFSATKLTLIYPATQSHLEKYREQKMHIVDESSEDYTNITLPFLEKERFSTKWVDNILAHEQEADRIVFEDPDPETGFVLLPDLKWDGKNVESLYLVALVHKRGIHSLRDLTSDHLEMLKRIKENGTKAITEKYGIPATRIRTFIHYQPTFYHLHIHFTNIQFDAPGRNAEKAHMLTTVISNLRYPEYYQNATIPFILGEKDPLYTQFAEKLQKLDNNGSNGSGK